MNTRAKLLLAAGGLLVVPTMASAQTPPPVQPHVYYACYQPVLGLVYRIKESGLPS